MRRLILIVIAVLGLVGPALAVQPDEVLSDQKLETRARELSRELRCMVCQNQSIDDSDAPLARDLRLLVRERLKAGDTNQQVLDFLVARYGEFVLLKPPFNMHTLVLWLGPAFVLLGGAVALVLIARRRANAKMDDSAVPGSSKLTTAEEARLARLLEPDTEK
jgi:cytochrome c-type biogenesis protein CcmH